jgi:hypothetical protein
VRAHACTRELTQRISARELYEPVVDVAQADLLAIIMLSSVPACDSYIGARAATAYQNHAASAGRGSAT